MGTVKNGKRCPCVFRMSIWHWRAKRRLYAADYGLDGGFPIYICPAHRR